MFKVEIDTAGAAFDTESGGSLHHEISLLLRVIGDNVREGATSGKVRDANGHVCGTYALTE